MQQIADEAVMADPITASIIIPTYNGSAKIENCLNALIPQVSGRGIEILVVDDGSTDDTAQVAAKHAHVRVIVQKNAGPATARNRGALEASGSIILFTDDDCVPLPEWVDAMLAPFANQEVVGAKGIYRTKQRELTARFVQAEYEDKYRLMKNLESIDFVDTYSAGFRRDRFTEMNGYDTSFPVACAEDVELSYRMSARGWLMKFVPDAVVYHTHPAAFWAYLRKKYKFAYWRVYAVGKNPSKGVKDSHTPQLMKLQLLLLPAVLFAVALDIVMRPHISCALVVLGAFFLSTLPFSLRAGKKDPVLGILCPVFLAARSLAQFLGVLGGIAYTRRHRSAALPYAG